MRDIFEDIFVNQPLDPKEAAQRSLRPAQRRRFYQRADVAPADDGFAVELDGKSVRTPGRRPLVLPSRALADSVAAEWDAQREVVDPRTMPLTRLVNAIIDGVADAPQPVAEEIGKYVASDLLFYRAGQPERLVARQAQHWDPLIAWARDVLGAHFILAEGVVFATQPDQALAAARAAIPADAWRLGALSSVTALTGSALIALALLHGRLTVDEAWAAAHVDEDWNMELWGRDEQALERRDYRFAEMKAAAAVLAACNGEDRLPRTGGSPKMG